ncbi:NACHT and WD repeat domain-containing protein [Kitasatospora sp. NPDC059648]|uniref:NACHT and WD repeat domain-containing protein n=1 Tax=Kitasatospora sp. NPDC059648 TaxID=3346894 RepID=UPI0036809E16
MCVDRYDVDPSARLEPARGCAEDFRALARRLGFNADAPIISGTKQQVEEGLEQVRRSRAERKLLYWVGHGVSLGKDVAVLPCRDYDPARDRGMFFPEELGRFVTRLSGDVFLIVDTCHAADIAYTVYRRYVDLEVSPDTMLPGPDGSVRSIGCLGTVGGGQLAQVGLWLGAWKELAEARHHAYRDEMLWHPYARAVHGVAVFEAVRQVLMESSSGSLVTPQLHGGGRLLGFFANPYYDPSARPVSAAAPTRRQELLGEQVQRLLRSRFPGLRLEEEGVSFIGRRHSLRKITDWLCSSGRSGIMVVTGAPGSGKSALLGQIAMMTIQDTPQYRKLTAQQRGRLAGAIDAGIQCRGRSAMEAACELARGMQIEEPEAGWKEVGEVVKALIEECRHQAEAAFLVDGLDETDPAHLDSVMTDVLTPLGQQSNVRVLVGTRRTIAAGLSALDATVHDLDEVPDRADDISEYVNHRLSVQDSPYRDDSGLRDAVARVLVERSEGVFLVARLHCSALVRLGKTLPPDAEEFRSVLASGLEDALSHEIRDLDRVASAGPGGTVEAGWARGLLLPLALSYGAGLPHDDDMWLKAAVRLAAILGHGVRYAPDDVRRIRRAAGAHIVEYGEGGQPVYRLSHEAMAHHLVREAGRSVGELHAALTDVLLGIHRTLYRGRGATNPYIARYATAHAAAAGRLHEVVEDAEFLVNAEPERLILLLDGQGGTATPEAELYRRIAEEMAGKSAVERSALLQATALYQHPALLSWARSAGSLFWADRWTTTRPVPPFRTLRVPRGDVKAVAAGSGGGLLAAGERLWHWPQPGGRPTPLHSWLGSRSLHALAAAPGDPAVAVAADVERVLVWSAGPGPVEPVREYGWGARVAAVAAGSPGGTGLVAAASGTTVAVWQWQDGRPHHSGFLPWPGWGRVHGVAVGALDGLACVLAAGDSGVVLWDARTGERRLSFGAEAGRSEVLAATDSGTDLHVAVLGTARPQLRVWRITGGHRPSAAPVHQAALRHPSGSTVVLRRHGGELLVAAVDGGTVRMWRVADGEELPGLPGHRTRPTSVAFLGDTEGSVCVADGSRIRVWRTAAGTSAGAVPGTRPGMPSPGSEHVGTMAVTEPGRGALALAAGGTARVWDLQGRHLADEKGLERVSSIDLRGAPDGTLWLAVGGRHPAYGPCLRVRTLPDGIGEDFPLDLHRDSAVTAIALSTGSGTVRALAAEDRYVRRWDVTGGEPLASLHVGVGLIEHLAVVESPGAEPFLLATAGDSVWAWERAEPGDPLRFRLPQGERAHAVAGTHDARGGRRLAVATSGGVFTGSLDEPPGERCGRRNLHAVTKAAGVRSLALRTTATGRLVLLAASRSRTIHEWTLDESAAGGAPKDRPVPDRGYEVHRVLAAPGEQGLLVAAVGLERTDMLCIEERR